MPPPAHQFREVAEVYDSLMSVVPYAWWVQYVRRLWWGFSLHPHRVLDLACGTGSVTEELLKLGYDAEGADISDSMLKIARGRLPEGTSLWQQDARALSIPGAPFDACVCLFDSLNYILELADLHRAMDAVRRHLVPGGSFIFDMNAIRALDSGMFNQSGQGKDAGLQYRWQSSWDAETRLCRIDMEFQVHDETGTRIFHEQHLQKGYELREITASLRKAGFEILAVYEAYSTHPPTARSDRYYFVARAPDIAL